MTVQWRKWAHENELMFNDKGNVRRPSIRQLDAISKNLVVTADDGFTWINNYPMTYPSNKAKFYKRVRTNVLKMMKKEGKLRQ
jgi:hypothetical protein